MTWWWLATKGNAFPKLTTLLHLFFLGWFVRCFLSYALLISSKFNILGLFSCILVYWGLDTYLLGSSKHRVYSLGEHLRNLKINKCFVSELQCLLVCTFSISGSFCESNGFSRWDILRKLFKLFEWPQKKTIIVYLRGGLECDDPSMSIDLLLLFYSLVWLHVEVKQCLY